MISAKMTCILTCVARHGPVLSFSLVIICHCRDINLVMGSRSQVGDVYKCFTCVSYPTAISIDFSPLYSKEGAISLWFSPHHIHRRCVDLSDSEIVDCCRHCVAVREDRLERGGEDSIIICVLAGLFVLR